MIRNEAVGFIVAIIAIFCAYGAGETLTNITGSSSFRTGFAVVGLAITAALFIELHRRSRR